MFEFTYHLDLLTNSYQFGLQTDKRLYILDHNQKLAFNPDLLDLICNIPSFSIRVDSGSATARRENGYWYVYKKITGILNKEYLGLVEDITEILMTETVRKVNIQKKKIKPNISINDHVNINPPPESAGHKKNPNHFQTSLIPANQEILMLKQEVDSLQATLAMGKTDYMILHEEIRAVQRDRINIIEQNNLTVSKLNDKIDNLEKALVVVCESGTDNLKRLSEHYEEIELAKLNLKAKSQVIADKSEEILEVLAEKDEMELKLINFACDLKKFNSVTEIIESYRNFAKGKNKQSHPRYSYLIDFLAEIDK